MVATKGKVVDSDDLGRHERRAYTPADDTDQRVVADRDHQPTCKVRRGAPAQRQAQMMNQVLEASRATGARSQYVICEPLRKDPPLAQHGLTPKAPNAHHKLDSSPRERQIGHMPKVSALHPPRSSSTRWTARTTGG